MNLGELDARSGAVVVFLVAVEDVLEFLGRVIDLVLDVLGRVVLVVQHRKGEGEDVDGDLVLARVVLQDAGDEALLEEEGRDPVRARLLSLDPLQSTPPYYEPLDPSNKGGTLPSRS